MAVAQDIGGDVDDLTERALGVGLAAAHERGRAQDPDPRGTVLGKRHSVFSSRKVDRYDQDLGLRDRPLRPFGPGTTHREVCDGDLRTMSSDESAVSATPALLEGALRATGRSVVISDPHAADNPIIYANPAFERLTGFSSKRSLVETAGSCRGRIPIPRPSHDCAGPWPPGRARPCCC